MIFFFQAEDGIRDLVRSRGLGDVYKRQVVTGSDLDAMSDDELARRIGDISVCARVSPEHKAVSYTHLTLPTSDLV